MSFTPFYTPKQMLEMGVFEGKYLQSTRDEYPSDWFTNARIAATPNPALNFFGVKSRSPLSVWQANGWIHPQDPFGWFQWYCRWSIGRRTADDHRQMSRWASFARHAGQVRIHGNGDVNRRIVQRQALLQWSHNPYPDFKEYPHVI